MGRSSLQNKNKEEKARKKVLREQRRNLWNPASSDFKGPWGGQKAEE